MGYSLVGLKESDTTDQLSMYFLNSLLNTKMKT